MPDALAKLYEQGKKGAFELKDLGAAIPQLGSQAATLGMTGVKGMTTLGGLAQIAQSGTGNAAEAQTALANLFNQIVAKSSKIQSGEAFGGHKVQVFEGGDPKKKMKDIRQILADMIGASGGNVQQLLDVGEIRGSKALNPMINAYKDAGGGAAGKAAVLKLIEDAADAEGTFKDVQVDAAEVMKSTSVQLEILNTKLQDAVNSKLLPALTDLIPKLEPLIPKFGELLEVLAKWIGWLAENPAAGLGLAITGAIVKDIVSAGIGQAVGAAITGAMSSAGGARAAGAIGTGLAGLAGGTAAGGGLLAGARAMLGGAAGAGSGAGLLVGGAALVGAAGAGYATYNQNEKLKGESGGLGFADLIGGLASGKGLFQQVNEHMDAQAKAAKATEDAAQATKDAALAMQKAAGAMQPGAPPTGGAAPNRGADPTPPRT
jgi:hypothetical protein